jgi:hypothetical protein
MIDLSREADKTISGASEVVAMAVTNIFFQVLKFNVFLQCFSSLTPVAMT